MILTLAVIDPFLKEWWRCSWEQGLGNHTALWSALWPGAHHLSSFSLRVFLSNPVLVKNIVGQQLPPARWAMNSSHWYTAGLESSSRTLVKYGVLLWSESCSVMSNSLWPHGLYSPWNSPGQNTGVGSLSLLQGIFSTQGSNPGLLHSRQILYQLSHKGSPDT